MAKKTQKRRSQTGSDYSSAPPQNPVNPNHSKQLSKLNRVEGQITGIKKMIEERRYCPDIIQQVRATRKALFTIESGMLEGHLKKCVSESLSKGHEKDKEEKIQEILQIFKSADSQGISF